MTDNRRKPPTQSAGTATLWKCPDCGAKLIAKNLSHACGAFSVEKFLEGKTGIGRELFGRFATLIARCGPYEVAPAKTRVAFMGKVRFASVNRVGADYIDVHFVLPRTLESPRLRKVEQLGKLYVHHLRLGDRCEFDRELSDWLRLSYREYGQRGWLTTNREGREPVGRRTPQSQTSSWLDVAGKGGNVATRTLDGILTRYPVSIQNLVRSARTLLLEALPDAQETIDGTAPVIGYGYGPGYKGLICSLLLSQSGVKLGLAHSAALPDPEHLLEGSGKVHRFVRLRTAGDLRRASLRQLLTEAAAAARARIG